jgi:hypothetical protein
VEDEYGAIEAVFIKLWSTAVRQVARGVVRFRRKKIAKIVSDTERMKDTPTRVCAKTAFVG